MSKSFWVAHQIIGSNVRFVNGRVYEVSPELLGEEKYDLVFLGALLQHLRDPVGALRAARSVCRGSVVASCVTWPEQDASDFPLMAFPYLQDKITWWLPNKACYRHWFLGAGFSEVDVDRTLKYRPDVERDHEGAAINREKEIRLAVARL
jgi:tRNA (mo5U34)-methyltransferase